MLYRYLLLALAFFPAAISGYWAYVRLLSTFVFQCNSSRHPLQLDADLAHLLVTRVMRW